MEKGTRIRVVKGRKHKGKLGIVFWTGPDKYREGSTRLGVHADDGDTIWIAEDYAEEVAADDPDFAVPGSNEPDAARGDVVRWMKDGDLVEGTVFWIGDSRSGPGHRLGVRIEGEEEAAWIDARHVTVVTPDDGAEAPPPEDAAYDDVPIGPEDIPF